MKERIKNFINNIWKYLKPYKETLIIPILKILVIIIVCVIIVKIMGGNETLYEYAEKRK